MITFKDILTTYWTQCVFILLGFGYFIKRLLDLKSKKNEINYTIFQQKRLETLQNFTTSYLEVEHLWMTLPIYRILERKLSAKDIDDIIFPKINKLKGYTLELKIYFEENDCKIFENLMNNMGLINSHLQYLYNDQGIEFRTMERVDSYYEFRGKIIVSNQTLYDQIYSIAKKTFKS